MHYDDKVKEAAARWQECRIMSEALHAQNVAASQIAVNRYYKRCRDWYEGRLALGYLLRTTGLRQYPEVESVRDDSGSA